MTHIKLKRYSNTLRHISAKHVIVKHVHTPQQSKPENNMKDLNEVLANMNKYAPFIKSTVFLELSNKRQRIIAARTVRAYKQANA